ncbi:Mss4p nuclear export [Entomortierella beljakovae]|nr:Mss4p nuclear export [Entomortierella beljakovae]
MSKRKAIENGEPEDVEMVSHDERSDDDSGSDGEQDIINVDFEFFDPKEIDFHAVKNLLAQYFASDSILFALSELSDIVVSQPNVGTTIKVNGEESDPFSILTVLNMNQHLYNIHNTPATNGSSSSASATSKPSQAMTQIRDYVYTKSKQNEKLHAKLKELLGSGSKKEVGLVISERFINMPVETAPPMWKMMLDEVKGATAEGLPFNFEYYLLLCPTYHEVAPKTEDDGDAPKPTKKKNKMADPVTFFFHPEEEMLQQFAEFTQDFKLTTPPNVAESRNTFEDYGIAPARRMMLIHKDKIPEVVQLMTNNSQW